MPQFLKKIGSLDSLTGEQLQEIRQSALIRHYKRGAVIFNEVDPADGLYIIKYGYVKVYQITENGKEKTLAILSGGDVMGEMAAFGQQTRSASAKTLEPVEILFIPQQRFQELLREVPAFGLKITEIVTERLRQANRQIARLVHLSSRDKVLYELLTLVERHGFQHKKGIILQPRLTHSDIASLAGVARETVTKTFNELLDEGIITVESRRVIVRDPERCKGSSVAAPKLAQSKG